MRAIPYDPILFRQMQNQLNVLLEEKASKEGEMMAVISGYQSIKELFEHFRKDLQDQQVSLSTSLMETMRKVEESSKKAHDVALRAEVKLDQDQFDWRNEISEPVRLKIEDVLKTIAALRGDVDEKIRSSEQKAEEAGVKLIKHYEKIVRTMGDASNEQNASFRDSLIKSLTDVRTMVDKLVARIATMESKIVLSTESDPTRTIKAFQERTVVIHDLVQNSLKRMDQIMGTQTMRLNELSGRMDAMKIGVPKGENLPVNTIVQLLNSETKEDEELSLSETEAR